MLLDALIVLLMGIFTYTAYLIVKLYGKIRNISGTKGFMLAETDQILHISPYTSSKRKPGFQRSHETYTELPQITFDKTKMLVKAQLSLDREEIFHFDDLTAVELGKEGTELHWNKNYIDEGKVIIPRPGHVSYTIYLRTSSDREIPIAKERTKRRAESIVKTIAKFLDVQSTYFERIDEVKW